MQVTEVRIIELPKDKLTPEHFKVAQSELQAPAQDEVQVKVLYISIDAANRAWMQGATYRSAINAHQVMDGYAMGEVINSNSDRFKAGDIVVGDLGWRTYGNYKASTLMPTAKTDPLSYAMSIYGITGLTAWHGLFTIGQAKEGETLVVSAAAGATGSIVGQLGKKIGMRVIGLAGTEEKCNFVKSELNFDDCLNYKDANFRKTLASTLQGKVDVYFDNVGGSILEKMLFQMNLFGRIACCGAVSQYDTGNYKGIGGIPGLLVVKRLTMKGFVVMDHAEGDAEALSTMESWVKEGSIKIVHSELQGVEKAPEGLIGLLNGDNIGKRIIKVN